jgi:Protein of unknown function (DUF2752)
MAFSWDSRRSISISAIVAATGLAVLYRFDPTTVHIYPPCVFHLLTGLECPGCGATRALYRLLHGDIGGAFRFNQLVFALGPFLLVAARWPRMLTKPAVAWTIAVVVTTYGIVRNLPFWPYPL